KRLWQHGLFVARNCGHDESGVGGISHRTQWRVARGHLRVASLYQNIRAASRAPKAPVKTKFRHKMTVYRRASWLPWSQASHSDDAAQKRVSRALDKLRDLLSQHALKTSAAALSIRNPA